MRSIAEVVAVGSGWSETVKAEMLEGARDGEESEDGG